jgi:transcriptional regulator with XRE-family HTH domain
VDHRRIGRVLRAVRRKQGLTQAELGAAAGVSQGVVSRAERGDLGGMTFATLERLASALRAVLHFDVQYQGGQADRLIDRAHARLVEVVVGVIRSAGAGWQVELEYSFNHFGERGSVDVLGWHAATRTLLIVEVKSIIYDMQAMLMSLGRKFRLVPQLVREERGWDAAVVARIIVADGSAANRAIVARHAATFDTSYPARSRAIRSWLRRPRGPIAGVWFVSREVARAGSRSR